MDQVMKLRAVVCGLLVLLGLGSALPAAGQGPWTKSFGATEIGAETTLAFSGGNLPAGQYRVEYVDGALKYDDDGRGYQLWAGLGGDHWTITHSTDTVIPTSGSSYEDFDTVAELEAAFGGLSTEFTHDGSSDISITFKDSPYDDNSLGATIRWRLVRQASPEDKIRLQILVTDVDEDDLAAVQKNRGFGDKKGGHQLPPDSEETIKAIVPAGLEEAVVHLSFGNLPKDVELTTSSPNVTINSATREATWDIEHGSQTFKLKTDKAGEINSAALELYCVYEGAGGGNNKADEVGGDDGVSVCHDKVYVSAGGCGCDSECFGSSTGGAGCLQFQVSLGQLGFGESAGYLMLFTHRPDNDLSKPGTLQLFLNDRMTVLKGAGNTGDPFTESGDYIEHAGTEDAAWGKAVLTVHGDGYGYDIKFYEDVGGTLATNPYRTLTVENLNGVESNDELYITETIDLASSAAQKVRMWHFDWAPDSGRDGSWILTEGEAGGAAGLAGDTILRITERAEEWNVAEDEVTETVTIKEESGTVVSKSEEVWKVYDWGRELISRTNNPDTTAADQILKEVWTYYDNAATDGDNYGRLESYKSETGYWERYEYDADGNVSKTMRQHEDETLELGTAFATEAADNIVEEYTEDDSVSVTFGGGVKTVRVEKWQIKVPGTSGVSVERTWYRLYIDEADSAIDGCTEEWSVRPVSKNPENGTTLAAVIEDVLDGTDTTSIVTKSWHWEDGAAGIGDNEPYDVRAMQAADGQITVYERTIATDERTTVVKRGFSDSSVNNVVNGTGGADIEYGTKTTSVTDARGNMVSSKTEKISESDNSGNWFIVSMTKTAATDEFGRPTETDYYFGEEAFKEDDDGSGTPAYDTLIGHGCCGGGEEETRTGRDGIQTKTLEDVLGRTVYTKRLANTSAAIYSVNVYDAAGRVVESGQSTDDDLSDATDLKSTRTYDKAGRMTSATDPEGRKSYMTYRRVSTSGGAYTTGVFYWETRAYGNDASVPVSVTWADSHGRTVLSYTGSCSAFAGTGGAPSGAEALTEHSRSTSVYDWDNRMIEGRAWFFINSLAKNAPGTAGTNYLVTGKTEYDALGRAFRRTDAAGNITETVYEDGTGRSIMTKIGVSTSDLHTVSRVYYKKFVAGKPTGDDRPWPTRVYTVKPGLTTAPNDSDLLDATPNLADYTYVQTVEEHSVDATDDYLQHTFRWSRPEHGPWSRAKSDDQGRPTLQQTFENANTSNRLTHSLTLYYPDSATPNGNEGKPRFSRQYEVVGGSVTGNFTLTTYYYDDAGRQVKTETSGGGFTKTEYDEFGRTKRTVFASSEGTNTAAYGANAFTDDIILTESVPTYDKSGLVTGSVTYERAHDAPGSTTGLLSAAAADQRRASYSYTWYDDNGRQTHSGTVGTDSSYTYNAASPPQPNTSDDRLVSKVEYDDAGRADVTTDNLGRKTKVFFDDLGRTTHTVENWDGTLSTPDAPGSRDADENRVTKTIYDNSATGGGARIELVAIDPDGDGTYTDNQSTLYIHSGEVDADERGPIPVNGRPLATLMPDAIEDGTDRADVITEINAGSGGGGGGEVFGDFSFVTYYADGMVRQSTDPRGVQVNSYYTDEGYLHYTAVTEATGNTWESTGDLRTQYTYGDAGEVLTITTYSVAQDGTATPTASNATSKLTYVYDGFYNVKEEKQDHDPTANSGAGDPKSILYAFDATVSSNVFTKAYRLDKVTYPNGRVIQLNYDGHSGIDDAIGRANAIEEDSTGNDIVSYKYLGSGRMVRKSYPTPEVRLDMIDESGEGSDANDDYELSLDAFGRPTRYQWETYDDSQTNDPAVADLVHIAHAYDRNSNRKYDERKVADSYSKVFTRDELDRINEMVQGKIKSDQSGIEEEWITGGAAYTLNQLGSVLAVNPSDQDGGDVKTYIYNDANEPTAIKYKGNHLNEPYFYDDFEDSATASNWELPSGSSDSFSIDSGGSGELDFTVAQDTYDGVTEPEACAILLWKDSANIGKVKFAGELKPDSGKQVGFVFGYKSPNDYYIAVHIGSNDANVYHIHKANPTDTTATKTLVASVKQVDSTRRFSPIDLRKVFGGNDIPSGRIGLWSNTASPAEFKKVIAYPDANAPNWLGRWRYTEAVSTSNGVNTTGDHLKIDNNGSVALNRHGEFAVTHIPHLTAEKFEVTFKTKYLSQYAYAMFRFAYQGDDDFYQVGLRGNAQTQVHHVLNDERLNGSHTKYASAIPSIQTNDVIWFRYVSDGSTITGYAYEGASEPDWATVNPFLERTGLSNSGKGGIGLGLREVTGIEYDDFKVKFDTDEDGDYDDETYELIETFTADGDTMRDMQPEHDAAGNLAFDGNRKYSYDSYNRLVMVQNAFKDPGHTPSGGSAGDMEVGSTIAEYAYDATGRRIRKDVYLGGFLDSVEHFYYTGWSSIETRNGSDQVTQQHVWDNLAGHYLDSLAQVGNNDSPGTDDDGGTAGVQDYVDDHYYALQDQQFNVLAITDDTGEVVERYGYTLYGERTVMNAEFVAINSSAYAVQMGFQGLYHDDETGLIYNRARYFSPALERFLNRDPLGYPDGMNSYAAYHVLYNGLDPAGLKWTISRKAHNDYAEATSDNPKDTFDKLAQKVGLDIKDIDSWLYVVSENPMNSWPKEIREEFGGEFAKQKIVQWALPKSNGRGVSGDFEKCNVKFFVPNTIHAIWMGGKTDAYGSDFDKQVWDLRMQGFKVNSTASAGAYSGKVLVFRLKPGIGYAAKIESPQVSYWSPEGYLSDLGELSNKRKLHGILIDSHGRAGHVWMADKSFKVKYSEMLSKLNYKLGAVLLNTCNGGWCAADNPQEGPSNPWSINYQFYGPPWTYGKPGDPRQITAGGRDLVSSSSGAVFSGLRTGLTPPFQNVDVPSLFPGDWQGTK